jgi:hypothetical protein
MFDLNEKITRWRQQMLAAGIKTPVPLEELESHLREEIERQMEAGMEPQAALAAAMEKIGQVQTLKTEFTKIGGAKKSVRWEQNVALVTFFGGILPVSIYALHKYDMTWGWRLAGLANIGTVALAIFSCRQINALFPVIPDRRKRWTVGITAAVTGAAGMGIFVNFILPHFSVTEGQLVVLVLWGLTWMAAGGVVLTGLEEAAKRTTANG